MCCVQHILSSLYMYLINFLTFNFKIFLIFTYLKDFIQKYKLQESFYIDHFVREKTRFSNYTNLFIKWALTKGIGNAIDWNHILIYDMIYYSETQYLIISSLTLGKNVALLVSFKIPNIIRIFVCMLIFVKNCWSKFCILCWVRGLFCIKWTKIKHQLFFTFIILKEIN